MTPSNEDRHRSPRRLATRVVVLAVTVGALVTAAAGFSGAGGCGGSVVGPGVSVPTVDAVCYDLVRTMAERVGIATALVTAILALTVIGLSRLVIPAEPSGSERPAA